ncbi:MAG: TadE/TadG family type IV pilus assembly protein [Myxococcaceae bacterium]
MKAVSGNRRSRESGQAAVEAALTLPLTLFLVLGSIQLMMMMQGRAMAQYAVARATRAGSLKSGECAAMLHTAIAAVLPTFTRTRDANELADAFFARRSGRFSFNEDSGRNETILWLDRVSPTQGQLKNEEERFDLGSNNPRTLIVKMTFWYPLRVPFANWVVSTMLLAHYGLQNTKSNPLMLAEKNPEWMENASLSGPIAAELQLRHSRSHYSLPIEVSYSMRMMTPARPANFKTPICAPYP